MVNSRKIFKKLSLFVGSILPGICVTLLLQGKFELFGVVFLVTCFFGYLLLFSIESDEEMVKIKKKVNQESLEEIANKMSEAIKQNNTSKYKEWSDILKEECQNHA